MLNCQKKLNKMNQFVTYMFCICRFKIFGQSPIYEGCGRMLFFLNRNCLIFLSINLCRCVGKSLLHIMRTGALLVVLAAMLTTISHQMPTKNRHLRHMHRLTMQTCQVRCCNIEGGSLHRRIHLPGSTRPNERMTFQWKA